MTRAAVAIQGADETLRAIRQARDEAESAAAVSWLDEESAAAPDRPGWSRDDVFVRPMFELLPDGTGCGPGCPCGLERTAAASPRRLDTPGFTVHDGMAVRWGRARPMSRDEVAAALDAWTMSLPAMTAAWDDLKQSLTSAWATLSPMVEMQRAHQRQMHSAYDRRRRARRRR